MVKRFLLHPYKNIDNYTYIDELSKLNALCEKYKSKSVLAIDTEFVRTQTLKPELGLIQVFDGEEVALIDPIAINDLSAFSNILVDENIVKVAHSCSEDLETLWYHLNIIPIPIFDTQIAAAFLDLGPTIGYANLVEKLFAINLDKGESRTDWIIRPLSAAQCRYAAADVTHLMAVYEHLFPQIVSKRVLDMVYDEVASLGVKKSHQLPSDLAYLQVKNNWKLQGTRLSALQLLAKWRLDEARDKNKSVNFIIKEVALFELAYKLPVTQQMLFDCHNLYAKQARLYAETLLSIIREAKAKTPEQCPSKIQRLIEFKGYKPCAQILKDLVVQFSQQLDIPEGCVASKKQINQLLKWCWFSFDELEQMNLRPDLISGWRRELFLPHLNLNGNLRKTLAEYHEIMRSL